MRGLLWSRVVPEMQKTRFLVLQKGRIRMMVNAWSKRVTMIGHAWPNQILGCFRSSFGNREMV